MTTVSPTALRLQKFDSQVEEEEQARAREDENSQETVQKVLSKEVDKYLANDTVREDLLHWKMQLPITSH